MSETFEWNFAEPEEYGLDAARLEAQWSALETRRSKSFLVLCRDHIVFERYAEDWDAGKRHYTASLAKALVGGLSLALAVDEGLIAPEDAVWRYVPAWRDDPLKSKITVAQLATHSSGIEDAELSQRDREQALAEGRSLNEHHMSLPGWKGAFWRQEPDPFSLARDQAPVVFEPGSAYAYSNPGMAMLSYVVTASLRGSPWPDIRTLLRQRLMEPIGLEEGEWSIGYEQTFEVEGLPLVPCWGGGSMTARAVARLGRLLLVGGAWQGRQLIGPAALARTLEWTGAPLPERPPGEPRPGSGLGWWLNSDQVWRQLPADAFAGAGAGNQILLVVPSLELVAVRCGGDLEEGRFWGGTEEQLFDPLMHSFRARPPCPPSPVITGVDWDPPCRITRLATGGPTRDGSDNWPMTWADDGQLYTAYGDGYGFEPGVGEKLGLGCAVVLDGPEDLRGLNIRSTAENSGYGAKGQKSSGLLMVDGLLYMWVRNADGQGCQGRLGFSADRARTWEWCDWTFAEFGHPGFINFGRGYAGARDDFVYIVSHDDPSAYQCADQFILMRVPRARLRQRSAYEFFCGMDGGEKPRWSADIGERQGVFQHAGQCRRSSISYNPGLGRYLWWQQLTTGGSDTRFEGGFGLYDAPEPWGPWTTTFFTHRWDVGPGDLGCFPAKWISADGRTVHLVFSGSDNFAVRRARLRIAAD